ncbi:MAG: hypothetical protein ACK4IS_13240 [Erythrobacter sp.]
MNAHAPRCAAGPGDQYRRLFGDLTPAQVMFSPVASRSLLVGDGTSGSPSALCDPSQAASHPLHDLLADLGHPSALSLAAIAALRARHITKGHTPQADAKHGWAYFKRLSDEAYRAAIGARSPDARRKRLITAIAILVAQVDAEDFQQQEARSYD